MRIVLLGLMLLLMGCGKKNEGTTSTTAELVLTVKCESEELLDAFLAGEIPAFYDDEKWIIQFEQFVGESYEGIHFEPKYDHEESVILLRQQPEDETDYFSYSVGERIDLDNDGENEQIINGPYGGIYIDARDGKVYVLAKGEGTAGILFYTNYDNSVWIVHSDTTHVGRQTYWLAKYDGDGNVVDEFGLGAAYWDAPDDKYDENSDFTFRDTKISMEEYEALRKEILDGKGSDQADLNEEVECMW
ncbi:MAG: hypothetical protein K2N44_15445 [Lachnospiraceae bacterium]|nr:hypothetical protein [Lachnospiraceae bacterium]